MTQEHIDKTVKEIKQSFRLYMNGITAQSLREKGCEYGINWGVSLQHLQEIRSEYEQDPELAQQLWQSNVRECKLLALMLMPHDALTEDTAMEWIKQTKTQEVAEIGVMQLFQFLPYAKNLALKLIKADNDIMLLYGYNIISRLLLQKTTLNKQEVSEFSQYANAAVEHGSINVRHAAYNALSRLEV